MASRRVKIAVEFPKEVGKLSKAEKDRLKETFGAEVVNVMNARVPNSLVSTIIQNVTSASGTSKKAAKGAAKKSSKKASKKG